MAPCPVGRGLFGLRYENRPFEIDDVLLTEVAQKTETIFRAPMPPPSRASPRR